MSSLRGFGSRREWQSAEAEIDSLEVAVDHNIVHPDCNLESVGESVGVLFAHDLQYLDERIERQLALMLGHGADYSSQMLMKILSIAIVLFTCMASLWW